MLQSCPKFRCVGIIALNLYNNSLIINTESVNFEHKDIHQFAQNCTQRVKNLPAMPETWVQSLGWEDPLEKGIATHSSILAWRIPWTENLEGYSSRGYKELDLTVRLTLSLSLIQIRYKMLGDSSYRGNVLKT